MILITQKGWLDLRGNIQTIQSYFWYLILQIRIYLNCIQTKTTKFITESTNKEIDKDANKEALNLKALFALWYLYWLYIRFYCFYTNMFRCFFNIFDTGIRIMNKQKKLFVKILEQVRENKTAVNNKNGYKGLLFTSIFHNIQLRIVGWHVLND